MLITFIINGLTLIVANLTNLIRSISIFKTPTLYEVHIELRALKGGGGGCELRNIHIA
jgi:hypothetical protein